MPKGFIGIHTVLDELVDVQWKLLFSVTNNLLLIDAYLLRDQQGKKY